MILQIVTAEGLMSEQMATPVEVISSKFPLLKGIVEGMSNKWEKRTRGIITKWPVGGTFDLINLRDMDTLIKNHKPKDQSEKRKEKKQIELQILGLFKDEAIIVRRQLKKTSQGESGKVHIKVGEKEEEFPPPYAPPPPTTLYDQLKKQMPTISGQVYIEGDVLIEERKEKKSNGDMKEGDALINIKGAEGRVTEGWVEELQQSVGEELFYYKKPEPCMLSQNNSCSSSRMEENGEPVKEIDETHLKAEKEKLKVKGYLEAMQKDRTDFITGPMTSSLDVRKKDDRERQRKNTASFAMLSGGEETDEEEVEQQERQKRRKKMRRREPELLTGRFCLEMDEDEVPYIRRLRSRTDQKLQASKQFPILLKGHQAEYVPWANQDLESLISRLPDIHEGAGKWIRHFEDETTGKLLAIGDIKALLAKILGGSRLNELLELSGLESAKDNLGDAASFDNHRRVIWETLRKEYPTQMDPRLLRGDQMDDTENPTSYIQRQLKRWRDDLEKNPEADTVLSTLFRTAILEAMPQPVKTKLEDVVGLHSKPFKEFCDYVSHAVEHYRKQELRLKQQERELQRRLTQLQLDELSSKEKKDTSPYQERRRFYYNGTSGN